MNFPDSLLDWSVLFVWSVVVFLAVQFVLRRRRIPRQRQGKE